MAEDLLRMTFELARAHLSHNNTIPHTEVPEFLRSIHAAMSALAEQAGRSKDNDAFKAPGHTMSGLEPGTPASATDLPGETLSFRENPSLVAVVRQTDISAPEFSGLDPWLAERVTPSIAAKLNRESSLHPTVFPDRLICLEDGAATKMLRIYVQRRFGLTFEQYLQKWRLPDDYPPNPPSYIENKRAQAKQHGFGVLTRGHRGRKVSAQEGAGAQPTQSSARPPSKPRVSNRSPKKAAAQELANGSEKSGSQRRRQKLSLFPENG